MRPRPPAVGRQGTATRPEGPAISDDIGHGTVLAGRYALLDLLSDHDGARFWRAEDTVLSRDVAVHVVDVTDPRAAAMLDAARLASGVHDPRLLRVLDADVVRGEDACAYVVHEWGEGRSVDLLLQQGPLSARRSAWLVKEVAECLAACHVQGVAHGRLLPETVLINEAGGVKLIGAVVDASLHPGVIRWPGRPEPLQEHEADMVNLASLLYACLTGRWPGTEGTDVPEAPAHGRRALRPRQVRAGIPRPLDRICAGVLSDPLPEDGVVDATAHEIAASLASYVGEPAPSEPRLLADPAERAARRWEPAHEARRTAASEDTAVGAPVFFDDDTEVGWSDGGRSGGRSGEHAPAAPPAGTGPAAWHDGPDEPTRPVQRSSRAARPGRGGDSAPAVPPTPVDGVRPLFADAGPTRTGADLPRGQAEDSDDRRADDSGPSSTSGTLWPFQEGVTGEEAHEAAGRSGHGWLRLAAALTALVVLVVAVVLAFTLGQRSSLDRLAPDQGDGSDAVPSQTGSTGEAQGDQGGGTRSGPWPIRRAVDFDPQGSNGENPEVVADALDGDPGTAWRTLRYNNRADLGGLKDGVGLVLDLGRQRDVGSVRLVLQGEPTSLELLAAPGRGRLPTTREGFESVGRAQGAGERVTVEADPGTRTRYVGVWLTSLPQVAPARFQGRVAEVAVRP